MMCRDDTFFDSVIMFSRNDKLNGKSLEVSYGFYAEELSIQKKSTDRDMVFRLRKKLGDQLFFRGELMEREHRGSEPLPHVYTFNAGIGMTKIGSPHSFHPQHMDILLFTIPRDLMDIQSALNGVSKIPYCRACITK